jgi:hypothetical protein
MKINTEAEKPTKLKVYRVEEKYVPTEIEVAFSRDGEVRLILTSPDQPEFRFLIPSHTAIAMGKTLVQVGGNAARIAERDERLSTETHLRREAAARQQAGKSEDGSAGDRGHKKNPPTNSSEGLPQRHFEIEGAAVDN